MKNLLVHVGQHWTHVGQHWTHVGIKDGFTSRFYDFLRNVKLCTPTGIGGELIFDATGIYAEFKLIIDFDGPQRPRK